MICFPQILIYIRQGFFCFLFFLSFSIIYLFVYLLLGSLLSRLVPVNVVDRELTDDELGPVLRSDEFSSSPIPKSSSHSRDSATLMLRDRIERKRGGSPLKAHLIVFSRSISCLYNDVATSSSSTSISFLFFFFFAPLDKQNRGPRKQERDAS